VDGWNRKESEKDGLIWFIGFISDPIMGSINRDLDFQRVMVFREILRRTLSLLLSNFVYKLILT